MGTSARPTTPADAFETPEERLRRVLGTRRADGPLRALGQNVTDLFRSNAFGEELAQAAVGAQAPVTTGRRIAVVGSRGGAGKTTTAALLARVYSAMRPDTIAAVDASTGLGTLTLRLGLDAAPTTANVATASPGSVGELAALMASAQENLLVAGSGEGRHPQPPFRVDDAEAATGIARTISRFCPVTVYDCATGMASAPTYWSLGQAHAVLFVTPASVAGTEDALAVADRWSRPGDPDHVPLLVIVTTTDAGAGLEPSRQAARLREDGIPATHLQYDRHLATGTEIDLKLLARRTRLQAAALASRALALTIDGEPR